MVAVQPLVNGGYCEARYIDEIIKNTEKLGPYYVLCENSSIGSWKYRSGSTKTADWQLHC